MIDKYVLLASVVVSFLLGFGDLLYKVASNRGDLGEEGLKFFIRPIIIFCFAIGALGKALMSIPLSREDASIIFPLTTAMLVIITSTLSILLLNESVGYHKILGISFCAMGALFLIYD